MKFGSIEILNLLTIVWLVFFSTFLFSYRKGNKLTNFFLGWLLATNAFFNLSFLVKRVLDFIPYTLLVVLFIGSSTGFFFGPAIYFYTKSLTNKNLKIKKTFLLHLIPFFLSVLYYLFIDYTNWRIIYFVLKYLHILIYIFFSFIILRNFQYKVKEFYSSLDKLYIKRLGIVLVVFTFLWFGDVIFFIHYYVNLFSASLVELLSYVLIIVNLIFSLFIVYNSLTHPELLKIIIEEDLEKKYKNSKLTKKEKIAYLTKLDNYMYVQKPYFNSSITLNNLSELTNIPSRVLSQIINESKKMNFYDYINCYRINEAKDILTSS